MSARHRRHDAHRTVKIECELLERDSVAPPPAKT
jgi:hypothetical protein